jgi:hypothetical protein
MFSSAQAISVLDPRKKRRRTMWPAMYRVRSTGADEMRPLFWAVALAAVAALLLLLTLRSGFQSIDRILLPSEPFLPYFTT